jgi:hypothetical protein
MKRIPLLITILSVFTFSQANAQISSDMQAMYMIKDFYTAYSSLNFKTADKSKLEALIDKYFTIEEGKILKIGYKKGHDIMTNDSGITAASLKTMTIQTISNEKALNIETGKYEINQGVKDAYEISYLVNPVSSKLNGVTTGKNILIDILVIKTNDGIKISYVTNGVTNSLRYQNSLKNKKN